jgi:hypothetical protein
LQRNLYGSKDLKFMFRKNGNEIAGIGTGL